MRTIYNENVNMFETLKCSYLKLYEYINMHVSYKFKFLINNVVNTGDWFVTFFRNQQNAHQKKSFNIGHFFYFMYYIIFLEILCWI